MAEIKKQNNIGSISKSITKRLLPYLIDKVIVPAIHGFVEKKISEREAKLKEKE